MFTIKEIYEYASTVRRKFLDSLGTFSWEEATKNREASFQSMKNIFIHMVEVEDWMVTWVIPDRKDSYKWDKFEEYDTVADINDFLSRVETSTRLYLDRADEKELTRKITLTLRSGDTFPMSPEECIFQAVTEQLYHMGELIALFWQQEVRPPRMQWFWNNPRITQSQPATP